MGAGYPAFAAHSAPNGRRAYKQEKRARRGGGPVIDGPCKGQPARCASSATHMPSHAHTRHPMRARPIPIVCLHAPGERTFFSAVAYAVRHHVRAQEHYTHQTHHLQPEPLSRSSEPWPVGTAVHTARRHGRAREHGDHARRAGRRVDTRHMDIRYIHTAPSTLCGCMTTCTTPSRARPTLHAPQLGRLAQQLQLLRSGCELRAGLLTCTVMCMNVCVCDRESG